MSNITAHHEAMFRSHLDKHPKLRTCSGCGVESFEWPLAAVVSSFHINPTTQVVDVKSSTPELISVCPNCALTRHFAWTAIARSSVRLIVTPIQ